MGCCFGNQSNILQMLVPTIYPCDQLETEVKYFSEFFPDTGDLALLNYS